MTGEWAMGSAVETLNVLTAIVFNIVLATPDSEHTLPLFAISLVIFILICKLGCLALWFGIVKYSGYVVYLTGA